MANHFAHLTQSDGVYGESFGTGEELFAGDRIGVPLRRRSWLRTAIWIATLGAAGWGAIQTRATWTPWAEVAAGHFKTAMERRLAASPAIAPPVQTPAPASTPIAPLPAATTDIAVVAGTELNPPGAEPAPKSDSSEAPASAGPSADHAQTTANVLPQAAPLPELQIDPADPYQKRAVAIGLHPHVSRAILMSLSESDYRNAGVAIRKALAQAADTEKFIWPKQANGKAAMFQVHFVTGDRIDCRRYIVTILKNGWTTTAPPMEKCGIEIPASKRTAKTDTRQPSPVSQSQPM